ncbi:MAG: hypothetical protein V3W04_02580 [Gammaproteobacteria bacterium]
MKALNSAKQLLTMLILSSIFSVASAASLTEKPDIRIFFGAGVTGGGEKLATVELEYDSGGSSNEDITSGGRITLTGGLIIPTPDPSFDLQVSFGWHTHAIFTSDDNIDFSRWPVEGLVFYKHRNYRFGSGITYHINPELDLQDINQPVYKFKNAPGWVFEAGYSLNGWQNSGFALGARFVLIDYELESVDNFDVVSEELDGNHFGIHANWMF